MDAEPYRTPQLYMGWNTGYTWIINHGSWVGCTSHPSRDDRNANQKEPCPTAWQSGSTSNAISVRGSWCPLSIEMLNCSLAKANFCTSWKIESSMTRTSCLSRLLCIIYPYAPKSTCPSKYMFNTRNHGCCSPSWEAWVKTDVFRLNGPRPKVCKMVCRHFFQADKEGL